MAWLSWILCILGAWTVTAPFIFPWDVCWWVWIANIVPGGLVFLLAGIQAVFRLRSLSTLLFLAAGVGIWIFFSPYVVGYYLVNSVIWANLLPGALIVSLGFLAGLYEHRRPRGWRET